MGVVGCSGRPIRGHPSVSLLKVYQGYHSYIFCSYNYYGRSFAVTEMDGIRILSQDSCDLIQKVPGVYT